MTVATASIYSMVLSAREFTDSEDILLRAFITRVGTSSMEVCVEMEQVATATRTHAFFVMVVLNHATNKPTRVPSITHVPEAIALQVPPTLQRWKSCES